jgi:lipopolysaccharide biosynthesis glycosyltransferase
MDTLAVRNLNDMLSARTSGFHAAHDYDFSVDWKTDSIPHFVPANPENGGIPYNLNAGVLIMNDDIPRHWEISLWAMDAISKYRSSFRPDHLGDQGIVNLIPYAFNFPWLRMGYEYNCGALRMPAFDDPAILHFSGGPKPWSDWNVKASKKLYSERHWNRWQEASTLAKADLQGDQ